MTTKKPNMEILKWSTRILSILVAIFLSLFSLDVFNEGRSGSDLLVALMMNLIPSFLVLIVAIVAWKNEKWGAIGFALLGLAYIIFAWGKFDVLSYIVISGPLFLIAGLFAFIASKK